MTTNGAILKNGNSQVTFTVREITMKFITDSIFSIGQDTISGSAGMNVTTKVADTMASGLDILFFPNPVQTLFYRRGAGY